MTRFPPDAEIVDGEPVATDGPLTVAERPRAGVSTHHSYAWRTPAAVPARQAAALAATSFVAGGVAVAVASRRAPRLMRRRRRARKGVVGEILSSNSFLVDVHLVRRG